MNLRLVLICTCYLFRTWLKMREINVETLRYTNRLSVCALNEVVKLQWLMPVEKGNLMKLILNPRQY